MVNDVAKNNLNQNKPITVIIRPNGSVTINYIRSALARDNFDNAVMCRIMDGDLISAQKNTALEMLRLYGNKGSIQWNNPAVAKAVNSGRVINLSDAGRQSQADDTLFSRSEDAGSPRLMAVHNLSESSLIFANDFGGLAVNRHCFRKDRWC